MGAIRPSHHSEAAELRGRLRKLADGTHALEQCFQAAWSVARLGDVELPPRDNAPDETYLLPLMRALGDRLEALVGALRQTFEVSSRELATQVVEFTLASLSSGVPDIPLEEVLQGIIPGYEAEARGHIRNLAADVVATFVPEVGGDTWAGGGGDPAAVEDESDDGQ